MRNAGNHLIRGGGEKIIENTMVARDEIKFGAIAVIGSSDRELKKFDTGLTPYGITLFELYCQEKNSGNKYIIGDGVELLRKGPVTIKLSGEVKKGERLYVDNSTGSLFRGASATGYSKVNVTALESGVEDDIIEAMVDFTIKTID